MVSVLFRFCLRSVPGNAPGASPGGFLWVQETPLGRPWDVPEPQDVPGTSPGSPLDVPGALLGVQETPPRDVLGALLKLQETPPGRAQEGVGALQVPLVGVQESPPRKLLVGVQETLPGGL